MTIIDSLINKIDEMDSPVILGLDSRPDYIPECVKRKYANNIIGFSQAVLEYNKNIIDSVCDIVPAVKIQIAYFEMLGIYGMDIYKIVCDYAKEKGLITIGDTKRSDIASVSKAYSNAHIGRTAVGNGIEPIFDTDFVTISPYLGSDTIKPFIEDCKMYDKGVFVVAKTTNKSSEEIQNLVTETGEKVYEKALDLIKLWGEDLIGESGYSSIGAWIGAETAEEYKTIRAKMPETMILIPTYSEKKETVKNIRPAFNKDGRGAVINVGQNIMTAYKSDNWSGIYAEEEYGKAARAETCRIRDEINKNRPAV